MYAQLGNIRFEGLKGFLSFRRTRAAKYAEMPRMDGKPRLQRTGDELETVAFDLRLHSAFGSVLDDYDTLDGYRQDGEVLPLIDGDGLVLGNYVIISISDSPEISGLTGKPISTELSVELKEFIDPNPAATAHRQAIADGFATSAAKVIPIRLVRIGTTPAAVTVQSVQAAELNSQAAIADVQKAAVAAEQKETLFRQAAVKAEDAVLAAQDAVTKLQDFSSLAAKAPALLATMESIRDNAELLGTRLLEGDITNALAQSTTLGDSLLGVGDAVRPINTSLILREAI